MRDLARIALLAGLSALAAPGAVIVTLDQPAQTGQPGATLHFFGTLLNDDLVNTVYLNAGSLNLSAPLNSFTVDDLFFTNVPVSLAPGASSGSIALFTVAVENPFGGTYLTPYLGSYQILGGLDSEAQEVLGAAAFNVAAVPEPLTSALLAVALAAIPALRRRQRS